MQRRLYSFDEVEGGVEQYLQRTGRRSQAVYLAVLFLIIGVLASLPFLRVAVSVPGSGVIRPMTERHDVRSATAGMVREVKVGVGDYVREGDPLFVLASTTTHDEAALVTSRIREREQVVADLRTLTAPEGSDWDRVAIATEELRREWSQAVSEQAEANLRIDQARADLHRTRILAGDSLIPRSEMESAEFRLQQLEAELSLLTDRQQARWQTRLAGVLQELADLRVRSQRLEEQLARHMVIAPVAGTIEEITSLSPGSFVQTGERVAVISPDSDLFAELFVSPRDVGLLRPGMPIRIHVDAFNYRDWGHVAGTIEEVSNDFHLVGQQPMFRVRAAMGSDFLELRNGFRGDFRKGMTLQARFVVADRTLLQLLRDNVQDWLTPSTTASAQVVSDGATSLFPETR